MKIKHLGSIVTVLVVILGLSACSSSGPKTQYYSLFPGASSEKNSLKEDLSVGVGPVILPEFLDNSAIVSVFNQNQVRVSGYHAWAGDLDTAIARVMTDHIASATGLNNISAFPWDSRAKPAYQIRIDIEDFSGELGGEVSLKAKWTLIDQEQRRIVATGREALTENTASNAYPDYVKSLNSLLIDFSNVIIGKLSEL